MMLVPGTILGDRYEIIEHIGSGGMADVYKAKCHKLNRFVAIKVLRQEYNEDENAVKKFIAEAQSTADLQHPNIVNVYDAEHSENLNYIVMELAEGTTLKKYIKRYGRLSTHETVDFALQIARGIEAAHAQKIVHRDIKPQNILVSDSGHIKVADFGIAKVASGNTVGMSPFGSVHYFSPEQARGGYADERSDIYSLGITIYEMATGKVPFDAENSVSIALKHLHEPITPPRTYYKDIPMSLQNIILKCTQKRPDARYQSMTELIADLEQVFDSPEGDFVQDVPLVDDSPTNVRPDKEIEMVKKEHRRVATRQRRKEIEEENKQKASEIYDDYSYKATEDNDDYEELESGSRRMIMGAAIIAGIAIVIIASVFVLKSSNLFGSESNTVEEASTTEAVIEKVEMPEVTGYAKDEAEKMLKGYGLSPIFEYEEGADENTAALVVKEQSVAAQETVLEGAEIILILGTEEAPTSGMIQVPSVANMTEDEAKEAIQKAGLKFKSQYTVSDAVKGGNVVTQKPAAGETLEAGSEVVVTISSTGNMVEMPSLIGLSEETARAQLEAVGLKLGAITKGHSNNVSEGEIMDQSESVGASVPENTVVDIKISIGMKITTYQASITIEKSPIAAGKKGSMQIVLEQDAGTLTIYQKKSVDSSEFPMNLTFDTLSEGAGTVTIYANGKQVSTQKITAQKVAEESQE